MLSETVIDYNKYPRITSSHLPSDPTGWKIPSSKSSGGNTVSFDSTVPTKTELIINIDTSIETETQNWPKLLIAIDGVCYAAPI